jgi:hypothetical protein
MNFEYFLLQEMAYFENFNLAPYAITLSIF